MWKAAFAKALVPVTWGVLALIIGLSPLYLIGGIMTRQMQEKVN
jgi:hypothetical protein